MSYAREYHEEHPMRQVGRYIRQYFDDVRHDGRREYDYDRPQERHMRFDNSLSYGHAREYGNNDGEHGFHRHMAQYWRDVKEDMEHGGGKVSREMMDAMAMVAAEAVRYCLKATDGHSKKCGEYAQHIRLDKAVEKLRRAPLQDRGKMMREMFPGVQGREQKVLQDMVSMEATEVRARRLGMSKSEYDESRHELARILHDGTEADDEDED
jgi:hypothetical protein